MTRKNIPNTLIDKSPSRADFIIVGSDPNLGPGSYNKRYDVGKSFTIGERREEKR